jgi:hypothetical protein
MKWLEWRAFVENLIIRPDKRFCLLFLAEVFLVVGKRKRREKKALLSSLPLDF